MRKLLFFNQNHYIMKKPFMFLAVFMAFAMIVGCHQSSFDEKMMANAPDAGNPGCQLTPENAYNLTIGSWEKEPIITYSIANYPAGWSQSAVEDVVKSAFAQWEAHIPQTIIQIEDTTEAHIKIRFEYLDGIGGRLGNSDFPPPTSRETQQVLLVFDKYDIQPDAKEGVPNFDFFSVVLHEGGHALGLKHSEDHLAVMSPAYTRPRVALTRDDIIGIRMQYKNNCSFENDGSTFVWLLRGDHSPVSQHFRASEFYTKCSTVQTGGHYLDSALIVGAQQLRTHYNQPVRIISSYRHSECNHAAGGASQSQHLLSQAVDFKFVGPGWQKIHRQYQSDIRQKRTIFYSLLSHGIRGFGGYPSSNHIDTRTTGARLFAGHRLAFWGTLDQHGLNIIEDDSNLYHENSAH